MGLGRIFKRRWKKPDGSGAESKYWSIGYPFKGAERVESSRSESEVIARRLLKQRLEEIGRGSYVSNQERVYFEDLVKLLKIDYAAHDRRSLSGALWKIKPLEESFGGMKAKTITATRIQVYVIERLKAGAARATINGELRYLRRMLRLGAQAEKLAVVPIIGLLDGENRQQGFVDPGDFERLLGSFHDRDVADLADFLYRTGWRVSTGLGLEWRDVSIEHRTVLMRPELSKNKEPLELPFIRNMEQIFRRREAVRRLDCPYVFHRRGRQIRDFREEWTQARERARLTGLRVHDLCRSAARNLSRAGVPETVASQYMNRKTLAIYKQYRIVDSGDLRLATQALESYLEREKNNAKIRPLEDSHKQMTDSADPQPSRSVAK